MTSIEHLRAFAKPLGVRILLENIPNELSTPEKLVEFIQDSHFDDVGVCFDVGHAHIMSDVAEAFETLKNYIHSTHIHDNPRTEIHICGRAPARLTGKKQRNCCVQRRTPRPCCWRSKRTRK